MLIKNDPPPAPHQIIINLILYVINERVQYMFFVPLSIIALCAFVTA